VPAERRTDEGGDVRLRLLILTALAGRGRPGLPQAALSTLPSGAADGRRSRRGRWSSWRDRRAHTHIAIAPPRLPYSRVIASPLRSALASNPTWVPLSSNTAPLGVTIELVFCRIEGNVIPDLIQCRDASIPGGLPDPLHDEVGGILATSRRVLRVE
jgi:hypothetical protein